MRTLAFVAALLAVVFATGVQAVEKKGRENKPEPKYSMPVPPPPPKPDVARSAAPLYGPFPHIQVLL